MQGRRLRQGLRRAPRGLSPTLEAMDARLLLSTGVSLTRHSLGPYLVPAAVRPRAPQSSQVLDAHLALNDYLAGVLGPQELGPIQQQVEENETSNRTALAQKVLEQPYVHSLLSNRDTYQLLNSQAMLEVVGVIGATDNTPTQEGTVRYLVPPSSLLTIEGDTIVVQIPPSGGIDGFIANVPRTNVRERTDGNYNVDVPQSQLPENPPPPISFSLATGSLSDAYRQTGPLLTEALRTGSHRRAPNAPRTVPGLRLVQALSRSRVFPVGVARHTFTRLLRVAVDRNVFATSTARSESIQNGVADFLTQVQALQDAGSFSQGQAIAGPLPGRPLDGTLEVTVGAWRNLTGIAPGLDGLQLPGGINFPGRIDVGYVIARNGDFGLILRARGPLLTNPPIGGADNLVGGDLRFGFSNATRLDDLNGLATQSEGLTVGAALAGGASASVNDRGVTTFGASAGYGVGLEYGTGVTYTRVIPLGNINALVTWAPPTR